MTSSCICHSNVVIRPKRLWRSTLNILIFFNLHSRVVRINYVKLKVACIWFKPLKNFIYMKNWAQEAKNLILNSCHMLCKLSRHGSWLYPTQMINEHHAYRIVHCIYNILSSIHSAREFPNSSKCIVHAVHM